MLLCLGLAYEKFGKSIAEEQETLLKLADLGIALYAAESAVLRTLKAVENNGENQSELKVKLAQALIDDTILDVEMTARRLFLDVVSGDKSKMVLSNLTKKLVELAREEAGKTKREIAIYMYAAEHYRC